MKIVEKRKILLSCIAVALIFFIFPSVALGIGQTTDPIIINDARRGETFQKQVIIVNTEKTSSVIEVLAEGDISGWTKFFNKDDLKTPIDTVALEAGETINILAEIAIPKDSKNGKYSGVISVTKKPAKEESSMESSSSVSQKINRNVEILVSDNENINIKVSVIPEKYDFDEKESIKVRLIYDNQGNVSVRPDANVKIKKDNKTLFNITYPFSEDVQSIKPKAVFEVPGIEIPTTMLEKGKYVAEINFVVDQKTISTEKFKFNIGNVEGASIRVNGDMATIIMQNISQNLTLLAFIGIIILAIIIFNFYKMKKERRNI